MKEKKKIMLASSCPWTQTDSHNKHLNSICTGSEVCYSVALLVFDRDKVTVLVGAFLYDYPLAVLIFWSSARTDSGGLFQCKCDNFSPETNRTEVLQDVFMHSGD